MHELLTLKWETKTSWFESAFCSLWGSLNCRESNSKQTGLNIILYGIQI